MVIQRFESKISVRSYCENCKAEFMTETPERGCPVCNSNKQPEAQKSKKKGGAKND